MKTIKNLTADQIRKSILQLAIQGKLVKQDPNDEPASELVKRIYQEKQRLIKEGKIKKDKQESYIYKGEDNCYYEKIGKEVKNITDELPFNIPDSWCWIRLSNYCYLNGGYAFKSSNFSNEGIRVIRISDFDENEINNKEIKRYPYSNEMDKSKIEVKDIIVCMTGGTVGKSLYIKYLEEPSYLNQRVALIRAEDKLSDYLASIFKSPYIQELVKDNITSTNDNISMNFLNKILIPIPPFNEQIKIQFKLSFCEPLIKKYEYFEKQLTQLEATFEENLKDSILKYAIEGKLVKQDPNDEPASKLLERIKSEKEALIKVGKIKREKSDSTIVKSDDKNYYCNNALLEVPFEIPDNWIWIFLPTIAYFNLGKTPKRNNENFWINGTIPWVSIADLNEKQVIYKTKEMVTYNALDKCFKNCIVKKDTLLMSFKLTIGKTSILGMNAVHNEAIISINPYLNNEYTLRNFLLNFLSLMTQYSNQTTAIKGNTLNKDKLNRLLIPLPPIKEILRINSKIKKVFKEIEN